MPPQGVGMTDASLRRLLRKLSTANPSITVEDSALDQMRAAVLAFLNNQLHIQDKTIEALVSTHLWAVYALDERNIACRPDLCNLATSTVELFGALPVHGSQFASRVARALLDAGLLDCYARIIAWFRARCAPAAATPISAPASAAAAEHDEDGYQRDVFSRWVKQACGLLQMMAHWTAHEHAAGMHAQLCAALERSQLLEHAAAALVTLATACAPAPLPSPPAGGTAAAGAASYAAAEPARGVASGDRAQPTSLRDQQAAKCWERVNNAVIRMMVAAAMLVDHCGLGSEMWPPHPHPGVLQALRPQAGSLQVAAQLRRVLSGRGVQLCLAWVLEAARPGVAEEPSVKPGVQGVRTPAVATPAGGSAGGSGARAAAVQQPPLAPAARWLPPALARPLVLSAHSSQGEKLDLSWVTAHIAASIWQLTASGPCVLPTAHPPHGSRPAGPCAAPAAPQAVHGEGLPPQPPPQPPQSRWTQCSRCGRRSCSAPFPGLTKK
mgnify:CR=1 FL=1